MLVPAAAPTVGWHADADGLPAEPGAYILRLELEKPASLPPRRFGGTLAPGCYLYFGSAWGPGGIRRRCARHLRHSKALHWHVDWLTAAATHMTVAPFPRQTECDLVHRALAMDGLAVAAAGFGSTDCRRCPSHLLVAGGDLMPRFLESLHQ